MKKTIRFWHLHHDILCEPLTEPIENRIKYIKDYKPKSEIALRLGLLKPVKGKLPVGYVKAYEAWDKAYEDNLEEIEALHKIECPNCTWNGHSIF